MNPMLDDWLEGQSPDRLKSRRRCLRFLKEAYTVCVGDFANKPRTDVTMTDAGFRFHIGTPLPDLRQIASWMLTHAAKKRRLAKLVPALWKRHGREDLSMAGLLLANLEPNDIGQSPWMAFIHLLLGKIPWAMLCTKLCSTLVSDTGILLVAWRLPSRLHLLMKAFCWSRGG